MPALLHTWYPGQEGGTAVAEVLFGKHNPEGKLPISFDRSMGRKSVVRRTTTATRAPTRRCTLSRANGQPVRLRPSAHIKYGDKLMVGYRYWTTTGKHPLFPFGFGLSYTTFSFSNLQAPATAASGLDRSRSAST